MSEEQKEAEFLAWEQRHVPNPTSADIEVCSLRRTAFLAGWEYGYRQGHDDMVRPEKKEGDEEILERTRANVSVDDASINYVEATINDLKRRGYNDNNQAT